MQTEFSDYFFAGVLRVNSEDIIMFYLVYVDLTRGPEGPEALT